MKCLKYEFVLIRCSDRDQRANPLNDHTNADSMKVYRKPQIVSEDLNDICSIWGPYKSQDYQQFVSKLFHCFDGAEED